VYNSFLNPLRSLFYIATMIAISFHLVHGVQSLIQTFGFYHDVYTPIIKKSAVVIAVIVGAGFSSIPLYVILHNQMNGGL